MKLPSYFYTINTNELVKENVGEKTFNIHDKNNTFLLFEYGLAIPGLVLATESGKSWQAASSGSYSYGLVAYTNTTLSQCKTDIFSYQRFKSAVIKYTKKSKK